MDLVKRTTGHIEATEEDVAEALSDEEGREVSVIEVGRVTAQALRKLRQAFARRGLSHGDLMPDR